MSRTRRPGRISSQLERLDRPFTRDEDAVAAEDPGTEVKIRVEIAPRYDQEPTPWPPTNTPGKIERTNVRAPGALRDSKVHPRKLGHVVLGTTDADRWLKLRRARSEIVAT